jgi:murein DD-endopeptidase MepM/ murein hydrolase activator NlpD
LKALEIELSGNQILTWERGDRGIVFQKRGLPYEKETKSAAGRITDSFYQDGRRGGLHPALISKFVDIFAWEINFQTDLRTGDSFRVLYERRFRPGNPKKESFRILAAELTNRKRKYHALFFKQENGSINYYDLDGTSLARSFLRYPVGFSRISSTFSHRRYHPILKVRRPHRGVDFVAKRGTPVRALGDGRITYAGWKKGGYGRFMEIQHGPAFKTRYAHLHRFARGLRRGKMVKKGQVIGTVGCSGRCTGPHLHFEMYKDRKYVNPLKIELPREEKIDPERQKLFESAKQLFLAQLVGSPRS